jgi:signal transduction histidine kinase
MQLYYTPTALVYLTQIFLTTIFGVHFAHSYLVQRRKHALRLAVFFLLMMLATLALAIETLTVGSARIVAGAFKYPLFAAVLLALVQFSLHFPQAFPQRRREGWMITGIITLLLIGEVGYTVWRIVRLQQGFVDYHIGVHDLALLGLYVLIPLSFLRQLQLMAPQSSLRALWQLTDGSARVLRKFLFAFLMLGLFGCVSLLRGFNLVSGPVANAVVALGMLFVIFQTAVSFVNSQPETTTLMFRLVGVTMATVLATLGVLSWYVALLINPQVDSDRLNERSLRYVPNSGGGYSVATAPYSYRQPGGTLLALREGAPHDCAAVEYTISYFGTTYRTIYVCNDGTIAFGRPAQFSTYQRNYGSGTPLFLALLSDLDPQRSDGRITVERVGSGLYVSWHDLRSFYSADRIYRFQALLRPDGTITVNYARVPQLGRFEPDERPAAGAWAVGVVPGNWQQPVERFRLADMPVSGGNAGLVHDFWLDYREVLSDQMRPFGVSIVAVSLFIALVYPQLFEHSLLRPLGALIAAVTRLQAGDYRARAPVTAPDELGFLTAAYNRMADELAEHVVNLERRVSERTRELDFANLQLQREMAERQAAEEHLVRDQRLLAALEERERLGRDLHDSLGQTFSSIALQAQTAQNLLRLGQHDSALRTLLRIDAAARRGHGEVRGLINALRDDTFRDLGAGLREITREAAAEWDRPVEFIDDGLADSGTWPPIVAENLLRISQEALANARRHAGAGRITVTLQRSADQIRLAISDDGHGMVSAEAADPGSGHGLVTMRERAEEIGGRLEISSQPGRGTTVSVVLPLAISFGSGAPEPIAAVLSDLERR